MFTRLTEHYFVSHHPLAVFWVQHGEALPDSWGVPVIITGSCAGLRICYIHNNEQTKCLCSQPKDKKKCLDSSLLFLCLCTSASNTRRSSIGFSHITLFTYYNFWSPSPIAFLRQQLCSDSSVGSNSPDDSLSNSSHVILIHPYLCPSSISPLILSKTYLAEPFPEMTTCDHYIYSALLVAPEEKSGPKNGGLA